MMTFRGVVTLDEDHIPAMVGLENETMSLVAGEVSIGQWPAGEYMVIDLGEGTFVIEVEEESIAFLPDDPGGFARRIAGEAQTAPASGSAPVSDTIVVKEGPPPQASTVAAFYTLVVVTAALGIWALVTLI
ncbi:MAG: hypothetical protein ACRDZM_12860 [Acidimicrobiia bacterium]